MTLAYCVDISSLLCNSVCACELGEHHLLPTSNNDISLPNKMV